MEKFVQLQLRIQYSKRDSALDRPDDRQTGVETQLLKVILYDMTREVNLETRYSYYADQ